MHDCRLWWSIYIKCRDKSRLLATHLPAVTDAIGPLDFEWEIVREEESPGLLRTMTFQNFRGVPAKEIVCTTLMRAGRLATTWNITGLHTVGSADAPYLFGSCVIKKPRPKPPSIESIVFELEAGHIEGMTGDGGWKIRGGGEVRIPS